MERWNNGRMEYWNTWFIGILVYWYIGECEQRVRVWKVAGMICILCGSLQFSVYSVVNYTHNPYLTPTENRKPKTEKPIF
jgi:hypothetical protein